MIANVITNTRKNIFTSIFKSISVSAFRPLSFKANSINGFTDNSTFSISNNNTRHNSSLSSFLKRELNEEKGNCYLPSELIELKENVSKHMKIIDTPANTIVTLERTYKDEKIRIIFNIEDTEHPDPYHEDHPPEESAQEEETNENEEEEDILNNIHFSITIEKKNMGQALIFDCTASDTLIINKVSHTFNTENEDESEYSGPHFDELEDDLKESFHKYLAERNIDDKVAQFIVQYADLKEQQEYITFLENTIKFIK